MINTNSALKRPYSVCQVSSVLVQFSNRKVTAVITSYKFNSAISSSTEDSVYN